MSEAAEPVDAGDALMSESDLLAIAACGVLGDLDLIRAALTSGDDDRIRRALAGPIAVVARSTASRLWSAARFDEMVGLSMPPDPVSTNELTVREIAAARAASMMFVDSNGYGFVPRVWLREHRGKR